MDKKRFLQACVIFLLALTTIGAWRIYSTPTSASVRDASLRALENKDAEALCRLADPKELEHLSVDKDKVAAILKDTLWRYPNVKKMKPGLMIDKPKGRNTWGVMWAGRRDAVLSLTTMDDPAIGWRLNLTDMLHSAIVWNNDVSGETIGYRERFDRVGILGLRAQGSGSFNLFSKSPDGNMP